MEGIVTLDGEPLPAVYVLFDQPESGQHRAFAGITDQQGRYELRPLGENLRGAAPGSYRVTLTTAFAEAGAAEDAPLPPERVPPNYRNGKLQFEVPETGTNEANFALTTG